MRLIRNSSHELAHVDKSHIVPPEQAHFLMRAQGSYSPVFGLEELRRSINACTEEDVRQALKRGDWLLIQAPAPYLGPPPRAKTAATAFDYPRTKEPWPTDKPQPGMIFAKSCTPGQWCVTDAGTKREPAEHFGRIMVAKSKPIPADAAALATSTGADWALGRLVGGGILQYGLGWMVRIATTAAGVTAATASIFIAGMLPARMGDGTLYSDEELRAMNAASTRVRFQFRRDAQGELQLYGIHTSANSGDDIVSTTKAQWAADRQTLLADLGDGITIIWTPHKGPLTTPELTHPQADDEQIGTILVHPIAQDTDSQIEGYPEIDDIILGDRIITFPADSGLSSLYVVYSKPFAGDHSYHPAPKVLTAFPDAVRQKLKNSVQGGGKKRIRWKDSKGRILEWDSQHGAVEMYDRQGKHLGEFDASTGEQSKPAKPGRKIEK